MESWRHCLQALLWSEITDDGEPLDSIDSEPSTELIELIKSEWDQFVAKVCCLGIDLDDALAKRLHPDYEGSAWNAAAHDFILTRNGHGCGFWDGDWWEPWASQLTDLAKSFGEICCYVGDDGLIYA